MGNLTYVIGVILGVVGAAVVGLKGLKAEWCWYAMFLAGMILSLVISEIIKRKNIKKREKEE